MNFVSLNSKQIGNIMLSETIPAFDFNELPEYFDETPIWSAPFGLKMLENLHYQPHLRIMDIGCGTGFPLTELALRFGKTCTVFGIDPWSAALQRLRKKLTYYAINNAVLIEGTAESIPIEDGSIDLIVSNNGLNNVQDLPQVLRECSRVSKAGAELVQTMNLDKSMIEFYSALELELQNRGLHDAIEKMHDHIYQKRRPVTEIEAEMNTAGFQTKEVLYDRFNYYFADVESLFTHYFIRLAFLESWKQLLPSEETDSIIMATALRMSSAADPNKGVRLSIPFALIRAVKR